MKQLACLIVLFSTTLAVAQTGNLDPVISDMAVTGRIDGTNLTFDLAFDVTTRRADQRIDLLTGDVVIEAWPSPPAGARLGYDAASSTYALAFSSAGRYRIALSFSVRPVPVGETGWREAVFSVPAADVRQLTLRSDRADLELEIPGAVRVDRQVADGELTVTAVQGARRVLSVRWKPQVRALDAELVVAADVHTIASLGTASLRIDSVFTYDIAQGKLDTLALQLPEGVNVTAVRGMHIRDWAVAPAGDGGEAGATRALTVTLSRSQVQRYALQVIAEMPVPALPTEAYVPVIAPVGVIRASGHLAVGTDHAVSMVVKQAAALSQIDASAMPRVAFEGGGPRQAPAQRAFHYTFTTMPYRLHLALDRIVPAYDAVYRMVATVGEDDLTLEAAVELDVRDAPVREVMLQLPAGFTVVAVAGEAVDDYRVLEDGLLRVQLQQPLLGRSVVQLRMERGRSPLDAAVTVAAMQVRGAKSQRGHIVIAVEDGIRLDGPAISGESIREINTASAPLRIAAAQFAYRFREVDWSLSLRPARKPASVRVEAFHLVSIGEGLASTSVAFSYFITGSPIDRFAFAIDPSVENIEFVGADVRRWERDPAGPARWIVTLQNKVEGDFNLGLTFSQRVDAAATPSGVPVTIAAARAAEVDTQATYIAVSSPLHVSVTPPPPGTGGLTEIDREELPGNYRLLVSAPLLRSFKHLGEPSPQVIAVQAYDRGSLVSAVVEFTRIESWIVPARGDRAESHTKVRYIVKNSSQQFLTLKMPAGVTVWSARQLEHPEAAGDAPGTRLAMVRDDAAGTLMIPIPRQRDPNAPITIEVEYGQVHAAPGWGGAMELAAPQSGADSTFGQWAVHVPGEWAVEAAGSGTLKAETRHLRQGDLRSLVTGLGETWAEGAERALRYPAWAMAAVIAAAALGLVAVFARWAVVETAMLLAALVLMWIGVVAAGTSMGRHLGQPDDLTTLTMTRVIDLREGEPLVAGLRVVPAWRFHLSMVSLVAVPVVAVVCLAGAVVSRRWRVVLTAAGLTGALFTLSRIGPATPWLGHALTWGVPAVVAMSVTWRLVRRWRGRPRVAAVEPSRDEGPTPGGAGPVVVGLLLLTGVMQSGCAATKVDVPKLETVAIERLDAALTAEPDAMAVELTVQARVDGPARVPLLDDRTILLGAEPRTDVLRIERTDAGYDLVMKAAGRHTVTVRCLRPLDAADESQARQFAMALPPAMSKHLTLAIPQANVDVQAATAVRSQRSEADGRTMLDATLGPNDGIDVVWRPRERQREHEATSFFASVVGVHRLDTGVISGVHELRLQIAQGQLDRLQVEVPEELTVTALHGDAVATWRFDSAARVLDVRLARPVSGDHVLRVFTQRPVGALPQNATLGSLHVRDAERETATLGLTVSDAVFATVDTAATGINANDFERDAQPLMKQAGPGGTTGVRFAYRMDPRKDRLALALAAVEPELRSTENASFAISDERLVYNAQFTLSVAKAGVFSAELRIPAGYDIDTLTSPQVGHWDEATEDGQRVATVHFTNRVLGEVPLQLTLSRPVAGLPPTLEVPRIEAAGALKHTGQVVIAADRGVRLAVAKREGVSELDAAAVGLTDDNALVYRLLRPAWLLQLTTEQVEPRISVESLHIARVGDGVVRHTHHLRYAMHHAGAKVFDLRLPDDAAAVLITGPRIARVEPLRTPGGWRVELTGRWFDSDGELPLTMHYETRYEPDRGELTLAPVRAGAHLQRGYVAVFGGDRVELSPRSMTGSLQAADARNVPRDFGAGDLSSAALCYRAGSADYALTLHAARRPTAALLEADVQQTAIDTVVTEHGQTINHVTVVMRVAGKRDLEVRLPDGSEVWSLLVNGRATLPSQVADGSGQPRTLIPLAQSAAGDLPVEVQFTYVTPANAASRWTHPTLSGPRFDLPLKNVTWRLYVPEEFAYTDFGGTLEPVPQPIDDPVVTAYDVSAYQRQNQLVIDSNLRKAVQAQTKAQAFAQQGQQRAARQQLESAWFYSQSDVGFNEDARVQLQRMAKEQALAGLVGNRARLRQQVTAAGDAAAAELTDQVSQAQLQRLRTTLAKPDSDNLDLICARIVDAQQAATTAPVALNVAIPYRGRMLEFSRAIQVEPDAPMEVSFAASVPKSAWLDTSPVWAAGVFLAVLAGLLGLSYVVTSVQRTPSDDSTQNGQ